ncbi:Gamma-aminobutyric acid (GABA) B receptor [Seminavis robusta]|uniref:Gamma-aminobutyric acid (GABA) B receptor n=1 Tax=Seminavis robusta TaxID=568900 RepID=A0A9N8DLZ4_9STRA|nr:Gamma-aminobutyric acid (GABA) B receptor [Seminavis robusta]|eukprot:Sro218_g089970.1 Gamma-aminobutyric acid (GABA) B receptor (871) ;mRNA; f:7811-10575
MSERGSNFISSSDIISASRIRYTDQNYEVGERQKRRQGHAMVLLPLSRRNDDGERELVEFRLYVQVAAFLAHKHLENLEGSVLPHLPRRLGQCDFTMTTKHHDTQFSPIQAARNVLDYDLFSPPKEEDPTNQQQQPFVILGAARSAVSQSISYLSSALQLPQVSASSTAEALDFAPYFARTLPNTGDAHASVYYLYTLGVRHFGLLFVMDSWGRRYEKDLQFFAQKYGMTLTTVPFSNPVAVKKDDSDGAIYKTAMQQLVDSKLKYFVAALNPASWKPVVRSAQQFGLMGNSDHLWLLPDLIELVGEEFYLDRSTEMDIALALHGTGVVNLGVKPYPPFDHAMTNFANDPELQQEFLSRQAEPGLLQNYTFAEQPGRSLYQYLTYDAMIAIGITACESTGLFTGREFYEKLLDIDFLGVSGRVLLDNVTGTRLGANLEYPIVNLVLSDYQENNNNPASSKVTFSRETIAVVEVTPAMDESGQSYNNIDVVHHQPFVHHDNSTTPPVALPLLQEDLNLIPSSVLGFCLCLAGLVMLLSAFFAIWVWNNRTIFSVKSSQPPFLLQLCLGTFIVAVTIVPMGWQEDLPGLDAACMSVPWTFCIGFALAISALWSKASRILKLLDSSRGFRRVTVKATDVMKSTVVLLGVNVVILTAWTASPFRMRWNRIPAEDNVDQFGRATESYGVCQPDESQWYLFFAVPLVVANVGALVMATYQSYRARHIPCELSEQGYLNVSLVSLCETFLFGTYYLVASIAICIGCLAILLPVFLPKYWQRHAKGPSGTNLLSGSSDHSRKISGTNILATAPSSSLHQQGSDHSNRGTRKVTIRGDRSRQAGDDEDPDVVSLRVELTAVKEDWNAEHSMQASRDMYA